MSATENTKIKKCHATENKKHKNDGKEYPFYF